MSITSAYKLQCYIYVNFKQYMIAGEFGDNLAYNAELVAVPVSLRFLES
jgi:hypothetical protein